MAIPTRFPIRFKILVAVLFVITAVVGIITFTMANLFHADKKTYIHDLVSVVALNTAAFLMPAAKRLPLSLCVPKLRLRHRTARRKARSAALFVGSTPS